jgi:tetratricopeptide (TPR) repeat protein
MKARGTPQAPLAAPPAGSSTADVLRSPRALVVWLAAAVLGAAVLFAFGPALGAGFVNWDDPKGIVENPMIRKLGFEQLRWMFTTTFMGPYQPLAWLSLAVNHAQAGLDPKPYHFTNLMLHAAAGVALLLLAWRLLGLWKAELPAELRLAAALVAAALFALHPLRCESVCWITERRDVIGAPFFFLALYFWLGWSHGPEPARRRSYALALGCFALALLSKASAVVVPGLFVLLDFYPRRRWSARAAQGLVLEKLPFAILALGVGVLAVSGQKGSAALLTLEQQGLAERAVVALDACLFYPAKSVLPLGLGPMYELPAPSALRTLPYVLPALGGLVLCLGVLLVRRRLPALAWCGLAYLIALAPLSGLLQAGPQLAADRYSYFACVPFALLAAGALTALALRGPQARILAGALGLGACLALACTARAQSRVWLDSRALWTRALELGPDSPTAHENLGDALLSIGQAASIDQAGPPGAARGLYLEAREHFTRALELRANPRREFNLAAAEKNLADLELEQRAAWLASAEAHMRAGEELARSLGRPVEPNFRFTHAVILAEQGAHEAALPHARAAAAGAPGHVAAQLLLGDLCARAGDNAGALAASERAASLAPGDALVLWQLARVLDAGGQAERARATAQRALALIATQRRPAPADLRLRRDIEAWLASAPR